MARKTFKIEDLIEKANNMLVCTSDDDTAGRLGIIHLLESVLFDTDNYNGFSYLRSEWREDGFALRDGYDNTRRRYY